MVEHLFGRDAGGEGHVLDDMKLEKWNGAVSDARINIDINID